MKKWKRTMIWILNILFRIGTASPGMQRPRNRDEMRTALMNGATVGTLTNHGAMPSVDASAVVTFGPNCSRPLPRSQVLSLLRSDCRASRRKIDLLVLHCSATWPSVDYTIEKLTKDHRRRGFGDWPGYHVYVRKDGTLFYCRPVSQMGCHVKGWNARSIGVCYEGGLSEDTHKPLDTRTAEQMVVLHEVLTALHEACPEARIVGHHELNEKKACPCLDFPASHEYAYIASLPKK